MTDTSPAASPNAASPRSGTLSLAALSCLVVGSMVGGGVFSLPQAFGEATGILGALIAWGIAGTGMLMLAFVFQTLSLRRPDIDAGIYAYARAGFGPYIGFIAALSYWASACLGNVAFLVLTQSTLGAFFPAFGSGNTLPALIGGSVILWGFHIMLLRGVKEAASVNTIVTFAKLLPIAVFLVIVAWSAKGELFVENILGGGQPSAAGLYDQVRQTMLIVVFVFLGIEGASVYSRLAKRREDVGRATLLGFLGVLALFVLLTLLSYGVLTRDQLAALHNPSLAGVLGAVVGDWGTVFVSIGVLVSVLGAFLAWSLLAAEVLFAAARNGTMPAFLARENRAGAPVAALWLTTGFAQLFLLLTMWAESAFRFAVDLTSATALIPYLFVAAYGVLLARQGTVYAGEPQARRTDLIRGVLATLCAAGMIYAGGFKFLLLSTLIFAPGTLLFIVVQREQGARIFSPGETWLAGGIVLLAIAAVAGLATGLILI